ncbi:hypothetical protein GIR35_14275 [Enterococcus faecalis]|nr:hypothetical protein GIR35_14275 [Enterococcus faecalis]
MAVTALILNGNLMPINDVFANEQSKDSTTAVSNEEVKKALESSAQLPMNDDTTNTVEKIPETTKQSNEQVLGEENKTSEVTEQSDAQTTGNKSEITENQQESPNNEKRSLTDVTVSTYEEFKAALQNSIVENIHLASDISLNETFTISSSKKNIYGNGHTIDLKFNTVGIAVANATCSIENVNLINQQIYSFFWSEQQNVTVNYTNVNSSGRQFIYLDKGTANLYGNINVSVSAEEVFQGKQLNIRANANVVFNDTSPVTAISTRDGLNIGSGAKLNLTSKGLGVNVSNAQGLVDIKGDTTIASSTSSAIRMAGGNLFVRENVKLIATSKVTPHESILVTNGSIIVKTGATLEASSEGSEATIQTGNQLVFENGSNFMITNTKGSAFGAWSGSTSIGIDSSTGLDTWLVKNVNSKDPHNSYSGPISALATVSGYTGNITNNVISNNAEFQRNFKSSEVGKIAGGNYVKKQTLAQTTISDITTDTTIVTGTGEPNAEIRIMNGSQIIAQGVVSSDGNYRLEIPKQAKGSVIKAIVEQDGLTSEASTTVTKGSLVQTTISNIDTTMTSVSGKAEPNATIQLKVGDKVIAEGKVGSDGLYSLTIPKQAVGTVVQAIATLDGLTSTAETVVVRGELAQTTISDITTETTTVTGTGEPNATIQLKVGDKVIAKGKVGSDGKYSLMIPKQPSGSVVTAVVTKDNKTSEASTVVKNAANATITKVDSYEEGKSSYVTGTYTGTGVKYIRVIVNGDKKALVPMTGQEAGKLKYYINGLKATDNVKVALYDDTYKELAHKNVTVIAPSAVSITEVDIYKEGVSNYVTGTYSGDGVAFMRIVVNGTNQALVSMTGQTQGAFKYYISNLKATDNVQIQLYNRDYTLLAQKQVPIESKANVTITGVEKYIEGNSEYVRGTYDGEGVAHIRLVVNGTNKAMVPVTGQAPGTFSYYAQGLKATDDVKVVLFDSQYRVLGEEKVIVEAPVAPSVTITSVSKYTEGKSEWITGSYEGADVSYVGLIINRKSKIRVPISDPVAKTFKYYKNGLKATDNVQVVLYNKKAEEVARKQLVITAPAVSNIKITSLSDYKVGKTEWITGSYEGEGVSLVGLIIDGNEKDTVKVPISDPAAKTFRYYKHDLKAGQNVQVVLYGKDGKEVARKQLVITP